MCVITCVNEIKTLYWTRPLFWLRAEEASSFESIQQTYFYDAVMRIQTFLIESFRIAIELQVCTDISKTTVSRLSVLYIFVKVYISLKTIHLMLFRIKQQFTMSFFISPPKEFLWLLKLNPFLRKVLASLRQL